MVTLLLGVQGGDEDALACLYAATNPLVVRYLRVVTDADPAPLALTTWSTLLPQVPAFVADDDDDWLELAIGTARESALAAGALRFGATGADPAPVEPAAVGTDPEHGPVGEGVALLRATGPAAADVLAMGVVAGLGRDSMARITGLEPTAVLALLHEGQARLAPSLDSLVPTMRAPGSRAELADLPAVLPLFEAQSRSPLPAAVVPVASGAVAAGAAAAGAALAASAREASVADLLTWGSSEAVTARMAKHRSIEAEGSSKWVGIGAGAAAWTLALAGVGTAAAMTGVIPAAIHNIFGDHGNGPVITAHGAVRPGAAPPQAGGGSGTTQRPPGTQPGPQGPVTPGTVPVGTSPSGDDVIVSTVGTSTQVVVVPAVLERPPTTPTAPTTPTTPTTPNQPGVTPPSPPQAPGSGVVTAASHAYGKGHPKHSTGIAKGRDKAASAAAKAQAAAARAQAKAAAARARAAAKAAAAQAKAAQAKAAKAAKSQA